MEEHQDSVAGAAACLRRPVVVQGSTWGFVHMPWDEQASHVDEVILESGAASIAISLLNDRVTGARSRHQQGILINRLMLGDINGRAFVERALRLGKDLRSSSLLTVIVGTREEDHPDLERHVATALRAVKVDGVTADVGDAVLSIVAVRGNRGVAAVIEALRGEGRQLGLSKVVEASELRLSIQQARAAFMARQPVQLFDKLGLLKLLVPLSNGPELAAFVEDELGALIAYDTKHDSQLYPTLLAFLRADGNKTTAAQELFLQRRTLYYRLDKIKRILDLDPEEVEARVRLQVAVQAAELLRTSRTFSPASGFSASPIRTG
jgi:purine catabolism regulator